MQEGFYRWLHDKEEPTELTELLPRVELIERLNKQEYQAFWDAYGIGLWKSDNGETVLRGGAPLRFDLNDGESYYAHVLDRLMREKNSETGKHHES